MVTCSFSLRFMGKRATRQDVARAAGVSGATVSRVYNTPQLVDKETADRVRAAAESLGFVPDRHAAALRRGTSATLLFVEIESGPLYRWPSQKAYRSLYGEIVRAVLHTLQGTAWTLRPLTLTDSQEISELERYGDFGGILGFDVTDSQVAENLARLGRPVVCCHHGDHLQGVSTVTTDNRAGGRIQAEYLIAKGFQKTAYITGGVNETRSHQLRLQGFRDVLPSCPMATDTLGFAEGRELGRSWAAKVKAGTIDSFACVNDLTALGVVRGLEEEGAGLLPGAVIGYDNLTLTELVGDGLPTIEAHLPQVYTRALQVLLGLTSGASDEVHETVAPQLVESSTIPVKST